MFTQLWNDESGTIVSLEIVLVGTVLGIGVITGLTSLRDGIITELADLGAAIGTLDQSFNYHGTQAHGAQTAATMYNDCHDFCDQNDAGAAFHNSRCMVICLTDGGECNSTP